MRLIVSLLLVSLALSVAGCKRPARKPSSGGSPVSAGNTETDVQIPSLPTSVEEYQALRNEIATTPEGGAAMFVVAMVIYSENPELGMQCITVQLDQKWLSAGSGGYKGKAPSNMEQRNFKDRIGPDSRKAFVSRSYVQGTSPANGYTLPAHPWTIQVRRQARDAEGKVFVHSTGADSPRPITLKQNNRGIWKAYNWNSLQVGCRPPEAAPVDDDF